MREIAISKFKATCLGVLEQVRKTGTPVRVTRFGRPVAEIVPPRVAPEKAWIGLMADDTEVSKDVGKPVGAFAGWSPRKP